MSWVHPKVLLLLWFVLGFALAMIVVSIWRRNVLSRLGDPELVSRLMASRDSRKRFVKNVLVLTAFAAAILSLAEPQTFSRRVPVVREGVDLVIAIDASLSMLADDVKPNRWELARSNIDRLLEAAPVDRVGLVAFAGSSQVVPLTADRRFLRKRLAEFDPATAPVPGSSVGNALQAGLSSFLEKQRKARILLLVSDGEDPQMESLYLATRGRAEGLHVMVVGVGTPEGHSIPVKTKDGAPGLKTDADGRVVVSKLNESLLKQVADSAGGDYIAQYKSQQPFADQVLAELSRIRQAEAFQDVVIEYDSRYQLPLLVAVIALLAEVSLSERKKPQEAGASPALSKK